MEHVKVFQNSGLEPIFLKSVSLGMSVSTDGSVLSFLGAYVSQNSSLVNIWDGGNSLYRGTNRIFLGACGWTGSSVTDSCQESVRWVIPVGGSFWVTLKCPGELDHVLFRGTISTFSDSVEVSNGVESPVPVDPFSWS